MKTIADWNRLAESFAQHPLPDRTTDPLLRHLPSVPQGKRALDIGCGAGQYTLALHQLGYEIEGLDPSPAMLEEAKKRTKGTNIHFHEAMWQDFARKKRKKYDLLFCRNSPAIQTEEDFRQALRLLRAGACFILSKPCERRNRTFPVRHQSCDEEMKTFRTFLEKQAIFSFEEKHFPERWERRVRREDYLQELRGQGFDLEKFPHPLPAGELLCDITELTIRVLLIKKKKE